MSEVEGEGVDEVGEEGPAIPTGLEELVVEPDEFKRVSDVVGVEPVVEEQDGGGESGEVGEEAGQEGGGRARLRLAGLLPAPVAGGSGHGWWPVATMATG